MHTTPTPEGLPLWAAARTRENAYGPARAALAKVLESEQSAASLLAQAQRIYAEDSRCRTRASKGVSNALDTLKRREAEGRAAAARIRAALLPLVGDTSPEAAELRRKATDLLAVIG